MRSPGENMRLWDLNWEIESSGSLESRCTGERSWHSAQQCQEDDVINQTCNLLALADSFYCKVVHL